MRSSVTADDIANNARMTRTLHPGTILIVEGDTDIRVYGRFVDETQCKLIPAIDKDNAVNALTILENDGVTGIVVIVDTDFWQLDGFNPRTPNLLLTDTHDLDTMILLSRALEKILSDLGSTKEIKKLGKPIREVLLEVVLPIGFLRWLSSSSKDNLLLTFKELPFERFIDETTLEMDIDEFIKTIKIHSENRTLSEKVIKIKIINLTKNKTYNPWYVCSGHDLIKVLSIGLRNTLGNKRARTITPKILEEKLRDAYTYSHFSITRLHNSIKKWETANTPFKVLNNQKPGRVTPVAP